MISRLSGRLVERTPHHVIIDVNGVGYEVHLPPVVWQSLADKNVGDPVELVTLYFLQIDNTRGVPVLLGFLNEVQKEFFERLMTVPKIGPKAALALFSRPVSDLAAAIEQGNVAYLRSLPGVGPQKAKDIIATLQGKVAKFALLREEKREAPPPVAPDVSEEALHILLALGHRRAEAERLVAEALRAAPGVETAEDLVRVIYRRQHEGK
ncbi:MAG: Holliday junction branch migration protein RuvA [Abditibacteriales bacterium]|nr:Holliday junction branch migration protein RuvA [Abditibacteriales bacterium]MDW8364584.1 Holliday junction branch migration protein RuvA [Abditibacteriales bacterium]